MKKRFFAITLLLTLLLPLVGCSTVPAETTGATTASSTSASAGETTTQTSLLDLPVIGGDPVPMMTFPALPDEDNAMSIQYLPETVENPQELPVLKWVILSSKTTHPWPEAAGDELNQMLAQRNMPFRLQFVILSYENYFSGRLEWCAIPEAVAVLQDADLICGSLTEAERLKYLSPITQHVTGSAQPSLKGAAVHELDWADLTTDGEIYAIPATWAAVSSAGWKVSTEFMDKHSLSIEDFQKDYWEMDELFAKIYAANGNQPFLKLDTLNRYGGEIVPGKISPVLWRLYNVEYRYQYNVAPFCVLDLSGEEPQVVNMMATDDFRKLQEAVIRYQDAGYILSSTNGATLAQVDFGYCNGGIPIVTEDSIQVIPVTAPICSVGNEYRNVSGIAAATRNKAEAVQLLNLMIEDEAFQTQLFFGKEGREYTIKNSAYQQIRQEDGTGYSLSELSMLSNFNSVGVMQSSSTPVYEGKTKLQSYIQRLDSAAYIKCPVQLDYSAFAEELTKIGEVVGNRRMYMINNQDYELEDQLVPRMTPERYDQMLLEMEEAGMDKVINSLQAQLDNWLAEHPDWSARVGQ